MGQTWGKLPLFDADGVDLRKPQSIGLARMNEPPVVRSQGALHHSGLFGKPGQVHAFGQSDRDVSVLGRVQIAQPNPEDSLEAAEDFVEASLIDRMAEGVLEDIIVRLRAQFDHLLQDFNVTSSEPHDASRGGGLGRRLASQ
ncbi:MAG: hypothetical protein WAN81_23345 [Candidatus Binataceae bacterium]